MIATELSPDAKALVIEGRRALRPTLHDKERTFTALRSRLGLSGGSLPVQSPAASPGGVVGGKAIVGLTLLLVGVAVYFLRQPRDSDAAVSSVAASSAFVPSVTVSSVASSGTARDVAVQSLPLPPVEVALADLPERSSASTTLVRPVVTGDRLAEEAALLVRAEKEYHAGHWRDALAIVEEHARKFPAGVLKQEGQKLRGHVLCGLKAEQNAAAGARPGSEFSTSREPAALAPCER